MRRRISTRATYPQNSWSGTIRRPSDIIAGLCLILDPEFLRVPAPAAMEQALEAGVRFFQYRSKINNRRAVYEAALPLSRKASENKALFIVNDHADIAAAVDAGGVHLGQDDLPIEEARKVLGADKIIGISTHSREQALAAQKAGADYIGYGPVFPTKTKDAGALQGTEGVRTIRRSVSIPIVAIGGIFDGNVQTVFAAGADGAAVISAILSAPDLKTAAAEMVNLISNRNVTYQGGV